jgi:hypothetical protein
MWQDPIVKETRKLREKYAARLQHDPDAIFRDIQKRQAESPSKVVTLPPRKPVIKKKCA